MKKIVIGSRQELLTVVAGLAIAIPIGIQLGVFFVIKEGMCQ